MDKHVSKSTLTSKHEKSAMELKQTKHDNQIIKQQSNGTVTETKTKADIKKNTKADIKIKTKTKTKIESETKRYISKSQSN